MFTDLKEQSLSVSGLFRNSNNNNSKGMLDDFSHTSTITKNTFDHTNSTELFQADSNLFKNINKYYFW